MIPSKVVPRMQLWSTISPSHGTSNITVRLLLRQAAFNWGRIRYNRCYAHFDNAIVGRVRIGMLNISMRNTRKCLWSYKAPGITNSLGQHSFSLLVVSTTKPTKFLAWPGPYRVVLGCKSEKTVDIRLS